MKISSPSQYIKQSYAANNANTNTTANTSANPVKQSGEALSDSINLSSITRDMQKIMTASAEDPKGRADKINSLKEQIQLNKYNVNAEQIAEKMMTGLNMNEIG